MAQTGTNTSSADELFDTEPVCFELADREGTFRGWVRHQDSLAGPAAPGGVVLFAANDIPAVPAPVPPATEPAAAPAIDRGDPILTGYTLTDCGGCCDQVIGEGCWNDGTDSGTYVSVRDSAGDVTLVDPATGDAVLEGDVVACPGPQYRTEVRTVAANESFVIPGGGVNLVSWSVRARSAGVDLNVSGVTTNMDENEIIQAAAQDDVGVLEDAPAITTGAGESARISWLLRTEP